MHMHWQTKWIAHVHIIVIWKPEMLFATCSKPLTLHAILTSGLKKIRQKTNRMPEKVQNNLRTFSLFLPLFAHRYTALSQTREAPLEGRFSCFCRTRGSNFKCGRPDHLPMQAFLPRRNRSLLKQRADWGNHTSLQIYRNGSATISLSCINCLYHTDEVIP